MSSQPLAQASESFDPRILRRALGNFATGVTIVTAHDGEAMVGVTANSFSSVSLDPPLVMWCIDKRSGSFQVFQRASHFAVNILAMDQIELSNKFARPGENRFAGVDWRSGHGGCIIFEDTSASFQCKKHQIVDGGDHWILIGQVIMFEDSGRAPLLYHQGSYSMVLPHPRRQQQAANDASSGGPRAAILADHPYYLLTQAVRSYQESYQPLQESTGWRPSEARIMMILAEGACANPADIVRNADMPEHQIEQNLDLLCSRGMVERTDEKYCLTAAGHEQVRAIWALARDHEEKLFAQFSTDQIRIFKHVLRGIIG